MFQPSMKPSKRVRPLAIGPHAAELREEVPKNETSAATTCQTISVSLRLQIFGF
jgi:hypothetical protein